MARVRVTTTVDAELLASARRLRAGLNDAALIDEALAALQREHRASEIDRSYEAYDERPLDEPDEWGDLAAFRDAAIPRLHRTLIAPCTTIIRGLPSEVLLEPEVAVDCAR